MPSSTATWVPPPRKGLRGGPTGSAGVSLAARRCSWVKGHVPHWPEGVTLLPPLTLNDGACLGLFCPLMARVGSRLRLVNKDGPGGAEIHS